MLLLFICFVVINIFYLFIYYCIYVMICYNEFNK